MTKSTQLVALPGVWSSWYSSPAIIVPSGGTYNFDLSFGFAAESDFQGPVRYQIIYHDGINRTYIEDVYVDDGASNIVSIGGGNTPPFGTMSAVHVRFMSMSVVPVPITMQTDTGMDLLGVDIQLPFNQSPSFGAIPFSDSGQSISLPDWIRDLIAKFSDAEAVVSPLVLDMGNDGYDLLPSGSVYWDIDRDGMKEASGWVKPADALLVYDKDNDQIVDGQSELFGNDAVYADGFAALKALDSNGDQKVSSADAQWAKLKIWQDVNGDGVSQVTELKTMAQAGIREFLLGSAVTASTAVVAGHAIPLESRVVMNDGSTRKIGDAWFAYDTAANDNYSDAFVRARGVAKVA